MGMKARGLLYSIKETLISWRPPGAEGNKSNKAPEKVGFSAWVRALHLKLQSFGHLMRRTDSLEKTVMLGKSEGMRRRG